MSYFVISQNNFSLKQVFLVLQNSTFCYLFFQGGGKQVELLNAVSRNNYTMLTFRRSLTAQDPYDLVSTKSSV
jgi:hypothetical protein